MLLDASHELGHHVFADSPNTGPWGTALDLDHAHPELYPEGLRRRIEQEALARFAEP